jgi:hypothetical protein
MNLMRQIASLKLYKHEINDKNNKNEGKIKVIVP